MLRKIINIILSIIIVILIIVLIFTKNESDKIVFISGKTEIKKQDTLSIMVQTGFDSGVYSVSNSSSWPEGYVLNESLSKCENGSKLSWDSENNSVVLTANTSDKCYAYFDLPHYINEVCSSGTNLATCISNFYDATGEGNVGLYKHDGLGTYGELEAGDNSYRYSGANPDNFVCFGNGATTTGTCPNDNLYRIIGTFNDDNSYRVKLIKYDYANSDLLGTESEIGVGEYSTDTYSDVSTYKGTKASVDRYYWNRNGVTYTYDNNNSGTLYNIWKDSKLNTLHLNTNYLYNIGTTWADKIDLTTWKVGGAGDVRYVYIKTIYINEISNNGTMGTYLVSAQKNYYSDTAPTSKIGLMYVSDYGYAFDSTVWNMSALDRNLDYILNWMYMGIYEHTITRNSDNVRQSVRIEDNGRVYHGRTESHYYAVRPVFYLLPSITISGQHKGTIADPIRIN